VEKILEADRRPLLADDVHHKYENKYDLANHMTNISIVAQMNVLERLGFTTQIIQQLADIKTKTTTLRFEANETCTFLKEQTVDVPDPHAVEVVKEKTSILGSKRFSSTSSTIHKVIKKVKEYHWTVKTHWEITVFSGTEVNKKIMIQSRDSSTVLITQSKDAPMEKIQNHNPVDLNLTWLLKQIDMENEATTFTIDTTSAKTPRRNEQVDASMTFFCSRMNSWLSDVKIHFSRNLQRIISNIHNPAVPPPSHPEQLANQCSAADLFQPILPVLEETSKANSDNTGDDYDKPLGLDGGDDEDHSQSVSTLALPDTDTTLSEVVGNQKQDCKLLSGKDTIQLLNAQVQSIDTKVKSLSGAFQASHQMALFSIAEATLYVLLDHSERLCSQYQHGIEFLEMMLEKQLVAAIGKRVTNDDLEEFVRFHNAKFLTIPPRPFCHAIGRPKRFPYGVLSIETKAGYNDKIEPIETMMRPVVMSAPLEISLNAATTLQLTGNTYLHGWMRHRSERGGTNTSVQLSARARQFSSFLLVIGNMAGPNKLNPKDAIILQNKDEVLIPLLLEEIPSAKEFKNAIESLSPEQQRFAKAFRGMQLESSVFGVAVIQIKPQLEALLGIPEDSLAKEIKLTEDLMELFVAHQVPSDLLSYDGNGDDTTLRPNQKVDSVRHNVKAVMDVIEGEKEKQLEKALMEEEARKAAAKARAVEEAQFASYSRSVGCAYDEYSEEEEEEVDYGCGMDMFGGDRDWSKEADEAAELDGDGVDAMPEDASREESNEHDDDTRTSGTNSDKTGSSKHPVDFTKIPKILDATIARFDKDSNLRSTKLKASDTWSRKRQPDLLTKSATSTLYSSDVKSESNKAYDLLDAISRSGSLPIAYSDLHVVVCVTHCFEKDIMATVVEDNVNPIEKMEMSTLLLGSAIHGAKPLELIAEKSERDRFPLLMLEAE